jgi:hypothetical protein
MTTIADGVNFMNIVSHELTPPLMLVMLKHDPEKWTPVFGKDHAQITS